MQQETIIIGISGPSASGKSLLANTIIEELGTEEVVVITEDSYYRDRSHLTFEEREKVNYDHPDAFEHELMCEHLRALRQGQTIEIPIYDFSTHERTNKTRRVSKHSITVLDGILLFADPNLRKLMDIRIFMDTALDVCLMRRLRRDMVERGRTLDSVLTQYENTVRPMYAQFIEPCKRYADVIVPRGGENRIAIDMLKAKMRELLQPQALV